MTISARVVARRAALTGALGLVGLLHPADLRAESSDASLLDLSIEELMTVEITSASKKSQLVAETAAAVFVITHDDIRRSAARNIPDLLRTVPGLQVAQIDANKWAVSARGFSGRFSNKLLVLMDGRALYTPSFGGVFWDVQDTLLDDIERIEIIRGPGGTLWGANAVNGVINIITRSSKDTQGGDLRISAESGPSTTSSFRFGGETHSDLSYRLYAKYLDESGNDDATGRGTADDWHIARVGIRTDWNPTSHDLLSWASEAYRGRSGETVMTQTLIPPYSRIQNSSEATSGFFSIAKWNRQFEKGRELQGHVYFDHTDRNGLFFGEKRDSAVLEIQYQFPLRSSQDIVAGAGIRHNSYEFAATNSVSVTPASPNDTGYNAFIQDEFRIIPNKFAFTMGIDVEHNALSENSVDLLPSGRLMLTINERNHLWTAVTKAISTPSYEQTGANVSNAAPIVPPGTSDNPTPVPLITTVVGNRTIKSERLVAYEIGDRTQLGSSVTLDTTLYFHDYQSLRSESTRAVFCVPTMVSVYVDPLCVLNASYVDNQLQFTNAARGHSSGIEVAADWVPSTQYRLRMAYTYLNLSLRATLPDPILVNVIKIQQGQSPRHQLSLRQDLSINRALDINLTARYVDRLPAVPIPAYWSADANIVWRPGAQWELSLTGRNLLQSSHAEYVSELSDVVPTLIDRTIGARIRWAF